MEDRPGAELVPQVGHQSYVLSLAYSPDGSRIASGDGAGAVRIWDGHTSELTAVLSGHAGPVNGVAYSPDSSRVASAGDDGTIRIWAPYTGAETTVLSGHQDRVTAVAYSPDGSQIASGGDDGTVRIWDPQTGTETAVLDGDSRTVLSLTYSPDGSVIASGGSEGVRIWDARTGRETYMLNSTARWVVSIAYSPDGSQIVTVSDEGTVHTWDAQTGAGAVGLADDAPWVESVAYSPDGTSIATGSRGEVVQIWDATTGAETAVFGGYAGGVNAIAYSPDGKRIVVGSHDGAVKIRDARTGKETAGPTAEDDLSSVAYSPDGSHIAVAVADGTVRVLAADTGVERVVLEGRERIRPQVAYSPDGRSIVTGSYDGAVRVWDAHKGELRDVWEGHRGVVNSVTYSPDGSRVASGSAGDGTLRIRDAETGAEMVVMNDADRYVGTLAFSPDGSLIASVSYTGKIRIWDAHAGSEIAILDGHPGTHSVAYSPDGSLIASGGADRAVRIWDVRRAQLMAELKGHESGVYSVTYSPDGRSIVSGSYDGTVRIWDVGTRQPRSVMTGAGMVNSVAYSPDGTRIASAAYEGWLRTWQVGQLTPDMVHQRLPGRRWIAFRPGRLRYVANSGAERHVRVRFNGRRCPLFRVFHGGGCPVYPLEWYRGQLRVDPRAPDLDATLQEDHPEIRAWELRMVWDRTDLVLVVFGVVVPTTVFGMLWIMIRTVRRRRTPLVLIEEFFAAASDYQVEHRVTGHALQLGHRNAAHHYAVLNVNGTDAVTAALLRRSRQSKDVPLLFLIQPTSESEQLHQHTQEAQRLRATHRINVVPMAMATLERALKRGTVDSTVNNAKDRYVTRHDPYFESIPVQDPTLFFGRTAQLQTIPRLLSQGQHVGIFGCRKTGKTSLAYQIRLRFRDVPVASVNCQELDGRSASQFLLRVADELRTDLRDRFDVGAGSDSDGNYGTQLRSLIAAWRAHGRSEAFVIILDELETLLPFAASKEDHDLLVEGRIALGVLRALAQELSGVVLVTIAKRPDVNRINRLPAGAGENPMFMGFREVYAGALSTDECDTMIRELGAWRGIEWDPPALRLLYRYCGGHPFVARLFASDACEQGRRTRITADRVERIAEAVRTARKHPIGQVYHQIFEDLRVEELDLLKQIALGSAPLDESRLSPNQERALADLEHFGLVNGEGNVEISPKLFEYWVTTERFA